jgi:hypothetical protein
MKKEIIQQLIDADPAKAVKILATQDPKSAHDLIFEHPDPPALAQQLPFEDAYLIIKTVGEADSIDLMAIMDTDTIQGFLDLDWWDRDEISEPRLMEWLEILMEFEDARFMLQLKEMDKSLQVALFKRYCEVIKIEEPDENPYLNVEDVFVTPDGRHVIRFEGTETQKGMIYDIFMRVYRMDQKLFYWLLEAIYWESYTEVQEYAYREKVGRLSGRGFPEYYDALEVFTYVDPDKFVLDSKVIQKESAAPDGPEASNYLAQYEYSESLLRTALAHVQKGFDAIQVELMMLVNTVSIAHQLSFANFMEVGYRVQQTDGYLSLALENICGTDPVAASEILINKRLIDLYKIGRSLVIRQARPLRPVVAQLASDGKSVDKTLFEPPTSTFIEAMLRRDPSYFGQDQKPGFFTKLKQIQKAKVQVEGICQVANLFEEHFHFTTDTIATLRLVGTNQTGREAISYSQLFCTSFANDLLGREFAPALLNVDDCKKVAALLEPAEKGLQIPASRKKQFFGWVEQTIGEVKPGTLDFFEQLFESMSQELGVFNKSAGTDARFLSTLIVVLPE